jgi:hypothetical protein
VRAYVEIKSVLLSGSRPTAERGGLLEQFHAESFAGDERGRSKSRHPAAYHYHVVFI